MRGLIEKDIRLISHRKTALLLFAVITVLLGFSTDGTFILGYVPFLMMVLGINTISYDEMDNGNPFLFSMPFDRKTYVQSKYIIIIGIIAIGWICALIIFLVRTLINPEYFDFRASIVSIIALIVIWTAILSVMIPVILKYGAEKSRIALAVIVGVIAVIFYVAMKVTENQLAILPTIMENYSMKPAVVVVAGTVISVAAIIVSYFISIKIMENKEF